MPKWYTIGCAYLLTLVVIWLTAKIFVFTWHNRPPPRFVYDTDVNRYANISTARRRIPRVIHQIMAYTKTWGMDVPPKWNASRQSLLAKNAHDFEYLLWTDQNISAFIQKYEPEFYKNTYLTYKYDMQRVDSFRYVLLYHLGGIYLDMDNGCNRPFKDLLNTIEALDPDSSHLAAFPRSEAFGVETDLLVTTPGHPLYKRLVSRLHSFNHRFIFHFWTILISAGPIYASIQERLFSTTSEGNTVRMIDYNVFQPMFIWKEKGHTWIGRDAAFLFFISAKSAYLLNAFIIFTIIVITLLFIRCFNLQRNNHSVYYTPLIEHSIWKPILIAKQFLFSHYSNRNKINK